MIQYLTAYLVAAVVFFGCDYVWLTRVATTFYRNRIGHLMADTVNLPVAAGFYLVYLVGLVIFAIAPFLPAGDWTRAALYGGLFGFFAYMTYDMTNLATLKNYPVMIAVVDVTWGTCVSAVSAAASVALTRLIVSVS